MAIARAHSAAGSSLRVTIVLAAAALMLTASPRATSHSTDERSTRFELTAHGSISLPVMLNGRGPYRMLLDTGSTHSVISSSIARSLAAPVVSRTVIVTPTGE